mgnify:CR=1 FL=1
MLLPGWEGGCESGKAAAKRHVGGCCECDLSWADPPVRLQLMQGLRFESS